MTPSYPMKDLFLMIERDIDKQRGKERCKKGWGKQKIIVRGRRRDRETLLKRTLNKYR